MSRSIWLAVASALLVWFAVERAHACSCAETDEPLEEAVERYEVVALGIVTSMQLHFTVTDEVARYLNKSITLRVRKSWKGDVEPEMRFNTAFDSASCGYPFQLGHQYLVFLSRTTPETLVTSICSPTTDRWSGPVDVLGPPEHVFELKGSP